MITLERVKLPTETLGSLYKDGQLLCKTLELKWADNKRGVSCIPNGTYQVTKEPPIPANDPKGRKERPYWHFRVHNVPGRSGILIHKISYVSGLKGCIGVCSEFVDLNKDGVPDAIGSTTALTKLISILPDSFDLEIREK